MKTKFSLLLFILGLLFSSCAYIDKTATQALRETELRLTTEYVRKTQMKVENVIERKVDVVANKTDSLFIKKKKKKK